MRFLPVRGTLVVFVFKRTDLWNTGEFNLDEDPEGEGTEAAQQVGIRFWEVDADLLPCHSQAGC